MGDAETIERRKKKPRILEMGDGCRVGAEQKPALADFAQQFRAILEARSINDSEKGRGRKFRQCCERRADRLPVKPTGDATRHFVAGVGYVLGVCIGEEIGDERRKARALGRLRERPPRNGCNQQ
jgi:hypothetical protein